MIEKRSTTYGGRGYFATTDIPINTKVLVEEPVLYSIFDDFKREVCVFCFHYENGSTLKYRFGDSSRTCSQPCLDAVQKSQRDVQEGLDSIYGKKKKLLKNVNLDLLRFCVSAMPLFTIPEREEGLVELLALQDDYDSTTVIERESEVGVVRALNVLFPDSSLDFRDLVKTLLGRSKCNCFGIWQQDHGQSFPESEMFGYCLYTRSSYFNHSCRPNVAKSRVGREMIFTTSIDIREGEELVISYLGDREYDDVYERRKALQEWGFTCLCSLCTSQIAVDSSENINVGD